MVPTTLSDHYKELTRFPVLVSESQTTKTSTVSMKRSWELLENESTLSFFLLLNHRFNALNKNISANGMVHTFTITIVETVDQENHIHKML